MICTTLKWPKGSYTSPIRAVLAGVKCSHKTRTQLPNIFVFQSRFEINSDHDHPQDNTGLAGGGHSSAPSQRGGRWRDMGRERRDRCSTSTARILGGFFGSGDSDMYHPEKSEVTPKNRDHGEEAAAVCS
ncbi:hypothetical protein DFH09DRAFT_1097347 [Mycena vulgaris]|nr:hypothetical protein DFH09DRAFT_1097347 [Mycena vulgaris]